MQSQGPTPGGIGQVVRRWGRHGNSGRAAKLKPWAAQSFSVVSLLSLSDPCITEQSLCVHTHAHLPLWNRTCSSWAFKTNLCLDLWEIKNFSHARLQNCIIGLKHALSSFLSVVSLKGLNLLRCFWTVGNAFPSPKPCCSWTVVSKFLPTSGIDFQHIVYVPGGKILSRWQTE